MFENMQVGPKSVWTSDSTMLSELDMARRDHRFAFRQRHWGSSQTAPASPQVMTPQLTNEEEEEGGEEKGRRRRRRGGGTRRTRTRRARTRTRSCEAMPTAKKLRKLAQHFSPAFSINYALTHVSLSCVPLTSVDTGRGKAASGSNQTQTC